MNAAVTWKLPILLTKTWSNIPISSSLLIRNGTHPSLTPLLSLIVMVLTMTSTLVVTYLFLLLVIMGRLLSISVLAFVRMLKSHDNRLILKSSVPILVGPLLIVYIIPLMLLSNLHTLKPVSFYIIILRPNDLLQMYHALMKRLPLTPSFLILWHMMMAIWDMEVLQWLNSTLVLLLVSHNVSPCPVDPRWLVIFRILLEVWCTPYLD